MGDLGPKASFLQMFSSSVIDGLHHFLSGPIFPQKEWAEVHKLLKSSRAQLKFYFTSSVTLSISSKLSYASEPQFPDLQNRCANITAHFIGL